MTETDAPYATLVNAAADAIDAGRVDQASQLLESALERQFEPVAAEALAALDRCRAGEAIDLPGVAETLRIDGDDDDFFGADFVVDASELDNPPDSLATTEIKIQPDEEFEDIGLDELDDLARSSGEMPAFRSTLKTGWTSDEAAVPDVASDSELDAALAQVQSERVPSGDPAALQSFDVRSRTQRFTGDQLAIAESGEFPVADDLPSQDESGPIAREDTGVRYRGGVAPPPPSHRRASAPNEPAVAPTRATAQPQAEPPDKATPGNPIFETSPGPPGSGTYPAATADAARSDAEGRMPLAEPGTQDTAKHPKPQLHAASETPLMSAADVARAQKQLNTVRFGGAPAAFLSGDSDRFDILSDTEPDSQGPEGSAQVVTASAQEADTVPAEPIAHPAPPPPQPPVAQEPPVEDITPMPGAVDGGVATDRLDAVPERAFAALPVADLLKRAGMLLQRGDLASAINIYDEVLAAEPGNAEAMRKRRSADQRMGMIRMAALEPLDRAPRADLAAAAAASDLTPQMMFLLTQADGYATLYDLIDLSGMSTNDATGVLQNLVDLGYLRF